MADVDGPISQVVIVSDPAKCPTGFTLVKRFSQLTVIHLTKSFGASPSCAMYKQLNVLQK